MSTAAAITGLWDGPIIDADVHANVPALSALFPYMAEVWIDWCKERGWAGPRVGAAAHYPPASVRAAASEFRHDGRPAASDAGMLAQDILDPLGAEYAIVNCYYGIDSIRHPDLSHALSRAVNDWLIAEWLEQDPRLRASLVLPPRDPAAMLAEIERVADHPGFVQAFLPVRSNELWGNRIFHPVLGALADRDLVAGLHYGGTSEVSASTTGSPSWLSEEYGAEWQSFAAQVTSLMSEGVFQEFPTLRVSVFEGGFLWAPVWGWRMNKEWKALRREVPWLGEPPLDVMRRHFRFSTAPFDGGPPEMLAKMVSWFADDDVLMFATDYPHGYDEDVRDLVLGLPESMLPKTMAETARAWYRLG